MNWLVDTTISMTPVYNAVELIGNLFEPGFELIPRMSVSESQQNAALAGGIVLALVERGPAGEVRMTKNLATKQFVQYTKSNLKLGQQMHKSYKVGAKGVKEFKLPSGKRIDFLDIINVRFTN